MGYGLGSTLCAGLLTLGLVIQWGLSRGQAEVGTNLERGYLDTEKRPASGTGRTAMGTSPGKAAETSGAAKDAGLDLSDVAATFGALSQAQQSRVMQRCQAVLKEPNQQEPRQLALCRTLTSMAKP